MATTTQSDQAGPRYNCYELVLTNLSRVSDCIAVEHGVPRQEADVLAKDYIVAKFNQAARIAQRCLTAQLIIIGGVPGVVGAINIAEGLITHAPTTTFAVLTHVAQLALAAGMVYSHRVGTQEIGTAVRAANSTIDKDDPGFKPAYKMANALINLRYLGKPRQSAATL